MVLCRLIISPSHVTRLFADTEVSMFRFLSLILMILALLPHPGVAATTPSATQETKRVLVLYSLDKGHPGHILTEQGLNEVFRANKAFDVQLFTEYLDMNRFPGPAQTKSVADYLRHKYADIKIDAIITIYPPALDLLRSQQPALFPDVPIIAGEVTRSYAERPGPRTGAQPNHRHHPGGQCYRCAGGGHPVKTQHKTVCPGGRELPSGRLCRADVP